MRYYLSQIRVIQCSAVIIFAFACSLSFLHADKASALSGSDFQAGRIIDDGIFFDSGLMNAQDVQTFLNTKVPTCDTNGSQMYNSSQTRAQYGALNGNPAPYTCLRNYSQNTPNQNGETGLCNYYTGGTKSAAQIISDVSQACGVSSKVLLVLLQKEQSIVTDTWPWQKQYNSATGFGCPDTAPCDLNYAGFFYQVYNAARQFKKYARDASTYNYRALRNNTILYSPNAGCGSSAVYIQNQATAGLYAYTPYQPNQAALNNLYGSGDSCSAYGNRNFWRMYQDWFGSTYVPGYGSRNLQTSVYTNDSRTVLADLSRVHANDKLYITVKVKNIGTVTWSNTGNNPIKIGTWNSQDRNSAFCDVSWENCSRAAVLREGSVAPGQTGSFEFWMKVPVGSQPGWILEDFNLLAEGAEWFTDIFRVSFTVIPTYSGTTTKKILYYSNNKEVELDPNKLIPNQTIYASVEIRNTGNVTWSNTGNNPIKIGTWNSQDRNSAFCDVSWENCSRAAVLREGSVAPGQTGSFEFWMKVPNNARLFDEGFNLLSESNEWFVPINLSVKGAVSDPAYTWSLSSKEAYQDSARTISYPNINLLDMSPGQTAYARVKAKNTGNTIWTSSGQNPTRIGTWNLSDHTSLFCSIPSWASCTRPAILQEASVYPGQIGTFDLTFTAPPYKGIHNEFYNLVSEGKKWFDDGGLSYKIKI